MQSLSIVNTFNGVTTSLESTSTTARIIKYIPEAPTMDESGTYEDVTDTIQIQFKNQTTAQAALTAINNAFNFARTKSRYPWRIGNVTLRAQWTASGSQVDSPIVGGIARFTKFHPQEQILEAVITRRPYFEDLTETAVPCGGTTSGLTVYNYTNGANSNHFLLDTSVLGGDVPTPIRWEITASNLAAGGPVTETRIGVVKGLLGALVLMYEGESGTLPAGATGTTQSVTGSSGGSVKRCSVISFIDQNGVIPISSYKILEWTVSSSEASALNGRTVRPVVRIAGTPPADVQIWLQSTSANALAVGDYVALSTAADVDGTIELPAIDVPPRAVLPDGSDTAGTVTLTLYARKMSAGSGLLDIDFLQLMPTDGWRKIIGDAAASSTVNDDPYNNLQYIRTSGGVRSVARVLGAPVYVIPGEATRVTINTRAASYGTFSSRTLSVKAYAKARRLSL